MYGISRLAGEHAALSTGPDHAVVIRTCGLYGVSGAASKGGNFVDQRIADARKGGPIEMGCDQTVSPTWTGDLSRAVLKLVAHPGLRPGVYHLVNEGECTWYEFTKEIYRVLELDIEVRPVDRKGLTGTMRRPLYSALGNVNARAMGISLPSWKTGLENYIRGRYGNRSRIQSALATHLDVEPEKGKPQN